MGSAGREPGAQTKPSDLRAGSWEHRGIPLSSGFWAGSREHQGSTSKLCLWGCIYYLISTPRYGDLPQSRSPEIEISSVTARPLQWVSSTARDRTFHKWIELAKCEFTPHTTVPSFDTAGWGPGGKMGWGPGRGQGSRPGENLGMGSNWAKFILKSGGSRLGSGSGSSSGRAPVTVYPVA